MKNAFTMIELVFVIVVLGILAGIAIPRLAATRDDATIAKMRGDLAAIRSGISLKRSQNMMRGDTSWPDLGANFSNVLQDQISLGNARNGWTNVTGTGDTQNFTGCVAGSCCTFTYNKKSTSTKDPASGVETKTQAGSITMSGAGCSMFQ